MQILNICINYTKWVDFKGPTYYSRAISNHMLLVLLCYWRTSCEESVVYCGYWLADVAMLGHNPSSCSVPVCPQVGVPGWPVTAPWTVCAAGQQAVLLVVWLSLTDAHFLDFVLFIVFTHWPKYGFFCHPGATRCPDTGSGPQVPHANFHIYWGKNVGIQPPKLSKFWILARNL